MKLQKPLIASTIMLLSLVSIVSAHEGDSEANVHVQTNVNSQSTSNSNINSHTHIEVEVNGEKKVIDREGSSNITVEASNGEINVKEDNNTTVTPTPSSTPADDENTPTPTISPKDHEDKQNLIEDIVGKIKDLFQRLFDL